MLLRTLAATTLVGLALAVSGCTTGPATPAPEPVERTDGDHPTEITETPRAGEVVHATIPDRTRESHFGYSEPQFLNWLSEEPARPAAAIARRVLPCDDAAVSLPVDRRVLDHAETVFEQDGYLISRQLTLYPDAATAAKFVPQLSETPIGCRSLRGSANLNSAQRLDYSRDRFFGTRDPSIVFSESDLTYGKHRVVFVDIVNRRDNAVVFTRVAAVNARVAGHGVAMGKHRNRGFVRLVRGEGDRGTAILGEVTGR